MIEEWAGGQHSSVHDECKTCTLNMFLVAMQIYAVGLALLVCTWPRYHA